MSKMITKVGPADNGRRMGLEEFEHAEVVQGYHYELSRGVVTVSDVPSRVHLLQVTATRDQLQSYKLLYPSRIHIIAAGSECKLLIGEFESERHPDLAVYLTPPPEIDDDETSGCGGFPRSSSKSFRPVRGSATTTEARRVPSIGGQGILDSRRR